MTEITELTTAIKDLIAIMDKKPVEDLTPPSIKVYHHGKEVEFNSEQKVWIPKQWYQPPKYLWL